MLQILAQTAGQTPVPLPTPTASLEDPITVATLVIALCTIVNLIVAFLIWLAMRAQTAVTRRMFEAAHRPYVGATDFSGSFNHVPPSVDCSNSVLTKNCGSIPALKLRATWQVKLGETELPVNPASTNRPMVLMPDDPKYLHTGYTLTKEQYNQLAAGGTLEVWLSIDYKGVTDKHYSYTQLSVLNMKDNRGWVVVETDST